ncbi:MAG: VCBS repeat-containing protein, partial [Gemmatimonadetes bacterium]
MRWAPLAPSRTGGQPGFTELDARRQGIDHVGHVDPEALRANRMLADGAGVALGDVDGDGLVDAFFASLSGPNALYLNRGGWRFERVPDAGGAALSDDATRGVALGDVDGDGDLDLVAAVFGGPNRVFLNDGSAHFVDAGPQAGLLDEARGSTTPALADVDGDGDLDLYIANYKRVGVDDLYGPEARAFDRVVRAEGESFVVVPEFREHYRIERDGNRLRRFEFAEPDEFYLNEGGGRFRAVEFTSGAFVDEAGRPLRRAPDDWSLSAQFRDLDLDGDPDLLIASDFESPDRFWMNRGDGTFQALSPLALRTTSASSMALDAADADLDGDLDLVTVDMLARDPERRLRQVHQFGPEPTPPGAGGRRVQVNRNTFQVARGDGTWSERAWQAGIAASGWTWSVVFGDLDLDAYPDLLLSTGHRWDLLDGDVAVELPGRAAGDAWRDRMSLYPPLPLPDVAFRNRGDLTFEDVSEAWGVAGEPGVSHAIALADLDRDGDLDAVITRLDAPPRLLRNDAGAPRVVLRLRGRAPNTRAVGAAVTFEAEGLPAQRAEVRAGGLYLSGSDTDLVFAVGGAARATVT